jgi:hypothetical protein
MHISFDVDKTNELALVPWSMYFRIWSKFDYSFVGKYWKQTTIHLQMVCSSKAYLKTLIFRIRNNQIIFYSLKKWQIPCHIGGQFDMQYVHVTIAAITMGN